MKSHLCRTADTQERERIQKEIEGIKKAISYSTPEEVVVIHDFATQMGEGYQVYTKHCIFLHTITTDLEKIGIGFYALEVAHTSRKRENHLILYRLNQETDKRYRG